MSIDSRSASFITSVKETMSCREMKNSHVGIIKNLNQNGFLPKVVMILCLKKTC